MATADAGMAVAAGRATVRAGRAVAAYMAAVAGIDKALTPTEARGNSCRACGDG